MTEKFWGKACINIFSNYFTNCNENRHRINFSWHRQCPFVSININFHSFTGSCRHLLIPIIVVFVDTLANVSRSNVSSKKNDNLLDVFFIHISHKSVHDNINSISVFFFSSSATYSRMEFNKTVCLDPLIYNIRIIISSLWVIRYGFQFIIFSLF